MTENGVGLGIFGTKPTENINIAPGKTKIFQFSRGVEQH